VNVAVVRVSSLSVDQLVMLEIDKNCSFYFLSGRSSFKNKRKLVSSRVFGCRKINVVPAVGFKSKERQLNVRARDVHMLPGVVVEALHDLV
jgi:hypothetical protein